MNKSNWTFSLQQLTHFLCTDDFPTNCFLLPSQPAYCWHCMWINLIVMQCLFFVVQHHSLSLNSKRHLMSRINRLEKVLFFIFHMKEERSREFFVFEGDDETGKSFESIWRIFVHGGRVKAKLIFAPVCSLKMPSANIFNKLLAKVRFLIFTFNGQK